MGDQMINLILEKIEELKKQIKDLRKAIEDNLDRGVISTNMQNDLMYLNTRLSIYNELIEEYEGRTNG